MPFNTFVDKICVGREKFENLRDQALNSLTFFACQTYSVITYPEMNFAKYKYNAPYMYYLKVPGQISQNGDFYSNNASSPKKSWFQISGKSLKPFGYKKNTYFATAYT